MFREIKRQIALFSTTTLVVFLVVFVSAIVFFMNWSLRYTGEIYLFDTANSLISRNTFSESIGDDRFNIVRTDYDQTGYDYIKWNSNDMIVENKVSQEGLIVKGYKNLQIHRNFKGYENFELNGTSYRMYQTDYTKEGNTYTLQVFQNTSAEKSLMAKTVSFLIVIGAAGAIVLFPISYLIAGKNLQPIKTSYEAQKKFVADASHELRTPLAVIQSNLDVLEFKEDETIKENAQWLNNIGNEAQTMGKLIGNLLLIAQADNQQIVLEKNEFDFSELCREMVALMHSIALENGVVIQTTLPDEVIYCGDREQIKQALRILIDNAIKYSNGKGTVTIALCETKSAVSVSVQDEGIGMSEEARQKIFDRFYRVDDARHREKGGFGLGLNIADAIVKMHKGKIHVTSELNVGSTFTMTLPK